MLSIKCPIFDRFTKLAMIAIERYIVIVHIDTTAVRQWHVENAPMFERYSGFVFVEDTCKQVFYW